MKIESLITFGIALLLIGIFSIFKKRTQKLFQPIDKEDSPLARTSKLKKGLARTYGEVSGVDEFVTGDINTEGKLKQVLVAYFFISADF